MAAAYLHGVETLELEQGTRSVKTARTAVIGLVGTAPVHLTDAVSLNQPVVIANAIDAAALMGSERPGFTIPAAIAAIQKQGAGLIVAINVFDPATHVTAIADEAVSLVAGTATLAHPDITSLTLTNDAGDTTYAAGTDYTLDPATGQLTGLTLAADASLKASYSYADLSKITDADIIGAVDASGNRTGAQALLDTFPQNGFYPKILIAPGFSSSSAVAAELQALAQTDKCRAMAYIDAPLGTTVAEAIAGRGPDGIINLNYADNRVAICYPHVIASDGTTEPLSQYLAGVTAATDLAEGYWVSPSNHQIIGVTGGELPLTARLNDANSEVNRLNEAGIVTLFNSFGTGIRVWGNRSSAFPSSTGQKQFIQTRRTLDLVFDSLEAAMLQYVDGPITGARIEAILQTVQGFLNLQISRSALLPGSKVEYRDDRNPAEQLAAGHIVFTVVAVPPPPMERITFEHVIDLSLLTNLAA